VTGAGQPTARPPFATAPDAERHALVADSLRRRQLCGAMLHGSRRNWRERRRSWPGLVAGAVVTAVVLASVAVYSAFQAVAG
jgi:hypothetical protein